MLKRFDDYQKGSRHSVLPVTLSEPIVKRYRFKGSDDESQPFGRRSVKSQEAAPRRKTMTVHASNPVNQEYMK